MVKGLVLYLELGILCLRLITAIGTFSVKLALTKLRGDVFFGFSAILLICVSMWISFSILEQKYIPKVLIVRGETIDSHTLDTLRTQAVSLNKKQLTTLQKHYEDLVGKNIVSQGIFTNLAQLHQIRQNQEQSGYYQSLSREITP